MINIKKKNNIKVSIYENNINGLRSVELGNNSNCIIYYGNHDSFKFFIDNIDQESGIFIFSYQNEIDILLSHQVLNHEENNNGWDNFYFLYQNNVSMSLNEAYYIASKIQKYITLVGFNKNEVNNVNTKLDEKVKHFMYLINFLEIPYFENIQQELELNENKLNFVPRDKNSIITYLNSKEEFSNLKISNCTSATLGKAHIDYWANPNIKVVDKDWYLILNDNVDRLLYILLIPKHTLKTSNEKREGFIKVRNDDSKQNALSIMLEKVSLIDKDSKIDFKKFIKQIYKY